MECGFQSLGCDRWPDFEPVSGSRFPPRLTCVDRPALGFVDLRHSIVKKGGVLNRLGGELPCSSREFWSSNG